MFLILPHLFVHCSMFFRNERITYSCTYNCNEMNITDLQVVSASL